MPGDSERNEELPDGSAVEVSLVPSQDPTVVSSPAISGETSGKRKAPLKQSLPKAILDRPVRAFATHRL